MGIDLSPIIAILTHYLFADRRGTIVEELAVRMN